jgi:hypothetical protein
VNTVKRDVDATGLVLGELLGCRRLDQEDDALLGDNVLALG